MLLEVDAIEVVYGPIRATHGLTMQLADNEIVALVGSNGAGKSSTLKAIMGLAELASGSIRFDGKIISGLRPYEVVRAGVALSPEGRHVFAPLTVMDNLLAGAHILHKRNVAERLEQIFTYFPRLRERQRQASGSLSGGEQQMLAIGRALMSRPRLLLLDEPSLGLAPIMVERIGELIRDIQQKEKLAVILAEQNSTWALGLADRGIVVETGVVKLAGQAAELREDRQVREAFLGI